METINQKLEKREERLQRERNVSMIESGSLLLNVSESETFRIKDVEAYQRLKVRLTRLKAEVGRCYTINLDGNDVKVTRNEDIVQ
jgi:hypothetical protein